MRCARTFYFLFSCELLLILELGEKIKKKAPDIYKSTLDIEFERDRSIGLGSMIGEGQTDRDRRTDGRTDRHTHTHTFFLKHIFRLWE